MLKGSSQPFVLSLLEYSEVKASMCGAGQTEAKAPDILTWAEGMNHDARSQQILPQSQLSVLSSIRHCLLRLKICPTALCLCLKCDFWLLSQQRLGRQYTEAKLQAEIPRCWLESERQTTTQQCLILDRMANSCLSFLDTSSIRID